MSYTFSRRNFMKYTVLAAAAVAVSGSLTACSNPNQPSGKIGDTLSFGGSNGILGIGGSTDKHTLAVAGTEYTDGILTCVFTHKPVSKGTGCGVGHYDLRFVFEDGNPQYYSSKSTSDNVIFTATNNGDSLVVNEPVDNTVKVTGLSAALEGKTIKEAYIRYFPRYNALGNEKDTYSDVYASWDITSLFAAE